MKKLFVLLVIALSAIGASGQGVYMVQEGDKFTQGDVITSVSNITLTLSPDGGKDGTGAYADGKAITNKTNKLITNIIFLFFIKISLAKYYSII